MSKKVFWPIVPILWGDSYHDDTFALRRLFSGGEAYDWRTQEIIIAPTFKELPPGTYRTVPSLFP